MSPRCAWCAPQHFLALTSRQWNIVCVSTSKVMSYIILAQLSLRHFSLEHISILNHSYFFGFHFIIDNSSFNRAHCVFGLDDKVLYLQLKHVREIKGDLYFLDICHMQQQYVLEYVHILWIPPSNCFSKSISGIWGHHVCFGEKYYWSRLNFFGHTVCWHTHINIAQCSVFSSFQNIHASRKRLSYCILYQILHSIQIIWTGQKKKKKTEILFC